MNASICAIDQSVNQRVTEARVRNAITKAGFDIDSLRLLPRVHTVAFVWCVTLTDGTRLAAKALGWMPLSGRVDRWKPSNLFERVDLRDRLTYESKRLTELQTAGYGPCVLASTRHVIVMDWVEGQPLGEALPQQPHVLDAVIDLIATLQARGFHHGDLHEGNVLIGPNGIISFLDPSFCFAESVGANERALFDYALLLGSVIAATTVSHDLTGVVRKTVEHLRSTQGPKMVAAMYDFARMHRRENRFLGALLSEENRSPR